MSEKKLSNKDFEILDSIRGIASLYVAIAHCRGTLWMGGNFFQQLHPSGTWSVWDYVIFGSSMLTRLAVEFVIVFFLLSGFSIAHSLSGNKEPLSFYKRRLVRIYPPYLVALLWAGGVFLFTRFLFPQWYDGSYIDFSFIRTMQMNDFWQPTVVVKNLFYMPGEGFITPFWSLTYEVIFYLLAPFLLRRIQLYLIVSLILYAAHWLFPETTASLPIGKYFHEFIFIYNIYFALGVALYTYYRQVEQLFSKISKSQHILAILLALGGTYLVNFVMKTESEYSFITAAILAVLLIIFFLRYKVRIRPLMQIGKYSYTLYITHVASIYLYLAAYWMISGYRGAYIENYLVWMGAIPVCLLIAYVQYLLVESRSKGLLNRMRQQKLVVDTKTS
ncbi:MAG: acyltransferase [Chitinophagaceae bacterium]